MHPKASQFHTISNKFQNQLNEVFTFIKSQTQTCAIYKVLRKNGLPFMRRLESNLRKNKHLLVRSSRKKCGNAFPNPKNI